jgi:hypothetical protein
LISALAVFLTGCTTWQPVEGPDGDPAYGAWSPDQTYLLKLEGGGKIQARRLRLEGDQIKAEVRSEGRYRRNDEPMDWYEQTIPVSSVAAIEEKRADTTLTVAAVAIPILVLGGLVAFTYPWWEPAP